MWVMEWILKIVAAGIIFYLVIGLLKTSAFYLVAYYCLTKDMRGTITKRYIKTYAENSDKIITNEEEETVETASWYEFVTEEFRQMIIEGLEKDMAIQTVRTISQDKSFKVIVVIFNFIAHLLLWPRYTTSWSWKFTTKSK